MTEEYVISKELIVEIETSMFTDRERISKKLKELRSRPLSEEIEKAREEVLTKVQHLIEYNDDLFKYMGSTVLPYKVVAYDFLLSKEGIQSLRGEHP